VRARPAAGSLVVGIEQGAAVDREAAAADAGRQAGAQRLERRDPLLQILAPAAREPLPVAPGGRAVRRQRRERLADLCERDAGGPAGLDQRDPAEHRAVVPALVAVGATGRNEALLLVEAEC